jgi:hypothetical protein
MAGRCPTRSRCFSKATSVSISTRRPPCSEWQVLHPFPIITESNFVPFSEEIPSEYTNYCDAFQTAKDRGKLGHIWFNTMFCCHNFCGQVFLHGDEAHPYPTAARQFFISFQSITFLSLSNGARESISKHRCFRVKKLGGVNIPSPKICIKLRYFGAGIP